MTRRAVQDFLKDNPSSLPTSRDAPKTPWEGTSADPDSDSHPMNRGLLQAHVGSLVVFMYVDGRYFLDLFGKYPASEAQAVAAFGREEVARHRRQGEDLAVDRRISAAVDDAVRARDGVKTPEELAAEKLEEWRRIAARAIKEHEKKTQRAADLMITRDLGEAPLA